MRTISNLIATALILWIASICAPDYIQFNDPTTFVIVVLIFSGLIILGAIVESIIMVLAPILAVFCMAPIALYIMDCSIAGFHVSGFWTYLGLSCFLAIASSLFYGSGPLS